jgi:hypothetical protein
MTVSTNLHRTDREEREMKPITRYGERGWQFRALDGLGVERDYRTNDRGDGLWILRPNGWEWKQVSGTGQYHLPADEAKALAQIERQNQELAHEMRGA